MPHVYHACHMILNKANWIPCFLRHNTVKLKKDGITRLWLIHNRCVAFVDRFRHENLLLNKKPPFFLSPLLIRKFKLQHSGVNILTLWSSVLLVFGMSLNEKKQIIKYFLISIAPSVSAEKILSGWQFSLFSEYFLNKVTSLIFFFFFWQMDLNYSII